MATKLIHFKTFNYALYLDIYSETNEKVCTKKYFEFMNRFFDKKKTGNIRKQAIRFIKQEHIHKFTTTKIYFSFINCLCYIILP